MVRYKLYRETRMRFSFIASSIFYSLLVVFGVFFRDLGFIISVFIGITTIAMSALGYLVLITITL